MIMAGSRVQGSGAADLAVLDALAVGVIIHDAELRIIYANAAATGLLGVHVADALARDVHDPRWVVIHPDGTPCAPDDVPASVARRTKQAVRGVVLGVRRDDATTTWLAVDGVPILDARGEVERIAVTLSDVTRELVARMALEAVRDTLGRTIVERDAALAKAVDALELTEARHGAVLRAMAEGVVVHAPDGDIVFANPAAEEILGLTLDQMRGRHPADPSWRLTDLRGDALAPSAIPSEITRLTGEPRRNVRLGVVRGTGERAWLAVSTDPIGEPIATPRNGGRYFQVATFTDVTAEHEALASAQHARDHLQSLAAALPGVVFEYLIRPDGTDAFLYVSAPAREYFGVEPERAIADSAYVWERVHPKERANVERAVRAAAQDLTAIHLDLRVRHRDNTYRHARLRAGAPVRVVAGLLFRGVVLDATEQRRLEETVREAQRREVMGTLAAGIAHNFNNMLAAIVPSIELAQSSAPPDIAADLEDARTAAHAAAELVRQLMLLVRKDGMSSMSEVDVAKLVVEVAQLCRRTFDVRVAIEHVVPPGRCLVLGRRAELQQVLVNLCINARDAVEGRPSPRVELKVEVAGDDVVVSVADNGSGIPPEVYARLGEPFLTTKAPGRGTGLGLATAYGIAAELRGTLTCETAVGQGTRFALRIPRAQPQRAIPSEVTLTSTPRFPIRALVIDDETLVRNTLRRVLARWGVDVLEADSGEVGLELFRANRNIQLVLVDLAMPGIKGVEVVRQIRAVDPTLAVYLMTGYLADGETAAGTTGVLHKPIDSQQLRTVVAAVTDATATSRTAP